MPKTTKITPTELQLQEFIKNQPEAFLNIVQGQRPTLEQLLPGDNNKDIRNNIVKTGHYRTGKSELRMHTRPIKGSKDSEIVALASLSTFDPGQSQTLIDSIADFTNVFTGKSKQLEIEQLWKIYKIEGIINNAINKIAAMLSGGGHFKVRNAKLGRKPEPTNKLLTILQTWTDKVNSSSADGVVTGARGLQSITHQGVRRALVEGDWIARHVWQDFDVLNLGRFKLPMNVQSITAAQLQPLLGLPPGAEAFYWVPPGDILSNIISPRDKHAADIVKQFIPKDMLAQLKKDRRYYLDPALMLHVRHRGVDTDVWGESLIYPALQAIAYKRAIDALDIQTMTSLINRLTIVMVGSSDPTSPYSKADVAASRQALMSSFFEDPGPNMVIIWAGDDVKIENIGADNVLQLDGRHAIAIDKIKMALGVPEALLSGSTKDGKAAGWAAALGSAAQLEELQNSFTKVWTQLGERIAEENNFTEVDIVFEFDQTLLVDKLEAMNQSRADFVLGLMTISDFLASRDKDPEAVFAQKCYEHGLDPANTTWVDAFAPPQGMQGQATTGPGGPTPPAGPTPPPTSGPGGGRQPNNQKGLPTAPDRNPAPTLK